MRVFRLLRLIPCIQLFVGLCHKRLAVHDEALLRALAHQAALVPSAGLEGEPTAVDAGQHGLAGHVQPHRRGGQVPDVHRGAQRDLAFVQLTLHTLRGGVLQKRHQPGRRQHGHQVRAEGLRRHLRRHRAGLPVRHSDPQHLTASASLRMYSGFVPQQPPTIPAPASTSFFIDAAKYSGLIS